VNRLVSALLFACLAFQRAPLWIPGTLFAVGMVTDLLDGALARHFRASTFFGKILDLIGDKSLTVVSLLYAAERGVSLLPLGIIAIREMISLGMRSIVVDGSQLLATSRWFGGVMAGLLWGVTLALVLTGSGRPAPTYINALYAGCAGVFAVNLIGRLWRARGPIRVSLSAEQGGRRS
jgi:phosphatidylglycerophosphate synthase